MTSVIPTSLATQTNDTTLRQTLELARTAAGLGLWIWDGATNRVVWDEQLCRIFRTSIANSPKNYDEWRATIHPEDRDRVEAHISRAVETGIYESIEHRILCVDDETRWILATGSVEKAPDGTLIRMLGGVLDITERRSMSRRVRDAQRMEALGRLVVGIAHNFNNALAVILPVLEQAAKNPPGIESLLHHAHDAAVQATSLVRELTALTRSKPESQPVLFDVHTLARRTTALCQSTLDRRVLLCVRAEESRLRVMGHEAQFQQVLLNLLLNARDAVVNVTNPHIQISVTDVFLAQQPFVRIEVTDNGHGMDEATRARLFEPFFTTKGDAGTGLGLATSHTIVHEHAGHIECRSSIGEGTTFLIDLPAIIPPVNTTEESLCEQKTPARKGVGVLIVDDEHLLRDTLRALLEDEGYKVFEATDGSAAFAVLSEHEEEIEVVLLDQSMPMMSGEEVIATMRARGYTQRVLIFSGVETAFGSADAVLTKPASSALLVATVDTLVERGRVR